MGRGFEASELQEVLPLDGLDDRLFVVFVLDQDDVLVAGTDGVADLAGFDGAALSIC